MRFGGSPFSVNLRGNSSSEASLTPRSARAAAQLGGGRGGGGGGGDRSGLPRRFPESMLSFSLHNVTEKNCFFKK